MSKYAILIYVTSVLVITSCAKESLDPRDFQPASAFDENFAAYNSKTKVIGKEDITSIRRLEKSRILTEKSAFWSSLEIEDVIHYPAMNDSIAIFRVITSKVDRGETIGFETRNAALSEVYEKFYFDTRLAKSTLRNRNFDLIAGSITFSNDIFEVGLSDDIDVDFTFDYDFDSVVIVSSYESKPGVHGGTFVHAKLQGVKFSLKGVVKFNGAFTGAFSPSIPPVAKIPIPEFGIEFSIVPALSAEGTISGGFQTTAFDYDFGPVDMEMFYTPTAGITYNTSKPASTKSPAKDYVFFEDVDGALGFKVGLDINMGPIGFSDDVRLAVPCFFYSDFALASSGSFQELKSFIDLNIESGLGASLLMEIATFGISAQEESEPAKIVLNKSNTRFLTCTAFTSASLDLASNSFSINIGKNKAGLYKIEIDNAELPAQIFEFNKAYTVPLSKSNALVHQLEVLDAQEACWLKTTFAEPGLLTSCNQKVLDDDGNEYCTVVIGKQTWMTENMRYKGPKNLGHIDPAFSTAEEVIFGRLYTYEEIWNGHDFVNQATYPIKGICPNGFHIPDITDWNELIAFLGGKSNFGKNIKLPNSLIWPGAELPSSSQFLAVAAGEYYPWRSNARFGNQFKKTVFWTANGTPKEVTVIEITGNSNEADLERQSQVGLGYEQKTIANIGYSCRCIKD
ncbi:MAG: hypothetical protein KDC49_08495 [Saprospiraceae bacterium]|nr:hypothetical protein [Saprospiraceae bacterium]